MTPRLRGKEENASAEPSSHGHFTLRYDSAGQQLLFIPMSGLQVTEHLLNGC